MGASVGCGLLAWRLPLNTTGDQIMLAAWLLVTMAGAVLCAVDLRVRRLPTPIIAVCAAATVMLTGAAAVVAGRPAILLYSICAAAAVGTGYLVLALVRPSGFGLGDVRLAAALVVPLGPHGPRAVLLGAILPFVLAGPVAGVLLLVRLIRRDTPIPFGIAVLAGALVAVLATS